MAAMFVTSVWATSTPAIIETPPVEAPIEAKIAPGRTFTTKEEIDALIDEIALREGVSSSVMRHIVTRESQYKTTAMGDTTYFCQRTGKAGPSYGLVQINTCWHPMVSYAEATSPEFALTFLAKELKKGNCHLWSTCPL